jgi:hypothetical protein
MTDREGLVQRIMELHEAFLERIEHGDNREPGPEEAFAAIICNNCGRPLVASDSVTLVACAVLDGWVVGRKLGDPDLCRGCAS